MAVIAVWQCDRDGAMFQNKKDADEHDKMLELAESISLLIEQNVVGVSEGVCEAIGLLLAKRREALAKACKGRPEALFEVEEGASVAGLADDGDEVTNVLPLKSKG